MAAMTAAGERSGVLVVRAWIEGDPGQLKARITHTVDLAQSEPVTSTAASADQIFIAVRRWLDEFEGDPSSVTGP
jgi:hypothetical protein